MGRRDTGLVAALVVIIILLSALAGRAGSGDDGNDPRSSTYVRNEGGLAALYWTLEELRIPVARRTEPTADADSLRGTLAIVAPLVDLTPEEASVVAEHVDRGGTLLFVAGTYDFRGAMYDTLGLAPTWLDGVGLFSDQTRAATPSAPHPWTAGVRQVDGFRRAFRDTSAALREKDARTLLAVKGQPVAVTWRRGKGRVIAVADVRPLANGQLRESGAAHLLARALAESVAGGDTVWFDEYHQGFSGEGNLVTGTWRMVRSFLSGGMALQLLAAAALLLLAAAVRFGAPLPPPPAARRSPLEHVEALAGAYRQADARHTVRRLLLAGMARRLGRRAPPDEGAAGEMLERMARQSPVGHEAAAQLQTEWRRGEAGDLVALTRGVDQLLDEVRR